MVGTVLAEMSLVASGGAQQIDMAGDPTTRQARLRILIPAKAYPVGARVTARLVEGLSMQSEGCSVLSGLLDHAAATYLALQVLPASLTPDAPLRVEFTGVVAPWAYSVLHARENDSSWTVAATPELTSTGFTFPIPEPGLWTVAQLMLPASLQGRLQRAEITCGDGQVVDPQAQLLDLAGDSFVWASPRKDSACYDVKVGTLRISCQGGFDEQNYLEFSDTNGSDTLIDDYSLDATGTGVRWRLVDWSGLPNNCNSRGQREHYVLLPLGTDPPPLPQMVNGRCPVDAGGAPDGSRD